MGRASTTEATQQKEEEELNGKNGDTAGAEQGPGVEATNADEAMAAAAPPQPPPSEPPWNRSVRIR